jgi:SulP family sulfate permease
MRKKLAAMLDATPIPIAVALRRAMAKGYGAAQLKADVMAGAVVGIVALPLSMALAIAVGVSPEHGLYTAIVAGAIVAVLGGSKHQVTGPTAAFIVILAPICAKYGLGGLLTAGLMAGIVLLGMGLARLGRLIEFIPYPVTTGFTAGIGTVIATLQVKDVLGLQVKLPDSYVEKISAMWGARATISFAELTVAMATLALLLLIPRVTKRIPAPLIAIALVSIVAAVLSRLDPSFHVATIGTRFHSQVGDRIVAGIPPLPPLPGLPWGSHGLSFGTIRELVGPALAIAMLGAIESLLSAVIADGMTGKKHDPNAELVALGVGNIVAPFFGGIAATGALARTATNVRAGAVSPIAAVVHSVFVLLAILLAAPLVAYVPMAALAGLLLLVAWNMSDVRHALYTLKVAPRSDVFVLLTCYGLTVVFDMVIAISVGVVLAALLFMRRMSELTSGRMVMPSTTDESRVVPKGVMVYEIAGPLFFGAAQRAMEALDVIASNTRAIVLALEHVPVIDTTGLVALESMLARLKLDKKLVIIAGPLPEPRSIFEKANLEAHHDHVFVVASTEEGIQLAGDLLLLTPAGASTPPPAPPRKQGGESAPHGA